MEMSSHVRGREAELIFAARCLELGIIHLEPTTTGLPYDALIQLFPPTETTPGSKYLRVQVKRAFRRRGPRGKEFTGSRWVATLKRSRERRYEANDADLLAIVAQDRIYMVPWSVVIGMREVACNTLSSACWLTEKWVDDHVLDYVLDS